LGLPPAGVGNKATVWLAAPPVILLVVDRGGGAMGVTASDKFT